MPVGTILLLQAGRSRHQMPPSGRICNTRRDAIECIPVSHLPAVCTMTIFHRVFNACDPVVAWRLVLLSWIAVLVLMAPVLMLTSAPATQDALIAVAMIPLAVHLYVFIANLPALRDRHDPARIGLTMPVLTYPVGAVACLPVMPADAAFTMPFAGIFMGMLTFGIFFTGLAPLLAIGLTKSIMDRSLNRRRVITSLVMLVTGWFLSGITGFMLGNG